MIAVLNPDGGVWIRPGSAIGCTNAPAPFPGCALRGG
jgi:hypothetical protein